MLFTNLKDAFFEVHKKIKVKTCVKKVLLKNVNKSY